MSDKEIFNRLKACKSRAELYAVDKEICINVKDIKAYKELKADLLFELSQYEDDYHNMVENDELSAYEKAGTLNRF